MGIVIFEPCLRLKRQLCYIGSLLVGDQLYDEEIQLTQEQESVIENIKHL